MRPRVETRLRAQPPDLRLGDDVEKAAERILRAVSCEASKHAMLRDRPQLVLAVIDVESAFDPFAVSYAGAVGLMQVMPFWPTERTVEEGPDRRRAPYPHGFEGILATTSNASAGDYRRALGR